MASTFANLGGFCQECQDVRLDDRIINGSVRVSEDDYLFLRRNGADMDKLNREVGSKDDTLPGLPNLRYSILATGCRMCQYLHQLITQLNITHSQPEIRISLSYNWCAYVRHVHQQNEQLVELRVRLSGEGISERTMCFKVESNDENVAAWLGIPRCARQQPWCRENVSWARRALQTSDRLIELKNAIPTFLPSRLIDLGDGNGAPIRLVSCLQAERTPILSSDSWPRKYCALSYCWGTEADGQLQIKTTAQTFGDFSQGIPIGDFPEVMRDAITVCRSLGVRYLWVDSLCILQDDTGDWQEEVEAMNDIYSNAYVTICAASSDSVHRSFLQPPPRELTLDVNFRSSIDPKLSGVFVLTYCGTDDTQPTASRDISRELSSPWSNRGWTFQESELSTRKLIFGSHMLYFQDRRLLHQENGRILPAEPGSIVLTALIKDKKISMRKLFREWSRRLKQFTEREFTYEHQKLSAVSGLAREFSKRDSGAYLAGLWRNDFPIAILWGTLSHGMADNYTQLRKQLSAPTPYLTPSWSFLAKKGCGDEGISYIHNPRNEPHFRTEAIFQNVETTILSLDGFGPVQGGKMTVQGKAIPVPKLVLVTWANFLTQVWITCDDGIYSTTCQLDWRGCVNTGQESVIEQQKDLKLLFMGSTCERDYYAPYLTGEACCFGRGDLYADECDEVIPKPPPEEPDFCSCYKTPLDECRTHKWCPVCHHCELCCTSPLQHNRNAWGLIISPTAPGADTYYRVGVFTSRTREDGGPSGTKLFNNALPEFFNIV